MRKPNFSDGCAPRLFLDSRRRAIGPAARQYRPDNPGGLVGHGNGDEPGRLALEQTPHNGCGSL